MSDVAKREDRAVVPINDSGAIMEVISRASSDPNTDVVKLEKMLDLYERVTNRQAEVAFNAALSRMQAALPEITERGEIRHNGKLISTYAKWEHVNRAIKPVLQAHGFGLSFRVDAGDRIHVEAVLSHEAGHSERTSIALPADTSGSKNPVQAVASSVSYGKRYTAGALLNITSHGEDDDAAAAGAAPKISADQATHVEDLIAESGANREQFLGWMRRTLKAQSVEDLNQAGYKAAVEALERKKGEKK